MTPPLPTRDDIARKHILNHFDKREGLTTRPDMAQSEDDDPTGQNFFRGLVNGLAITGLFAIVFGAAWIMTS